MTALDLAGDRADLVSRIGALQAEQGRAVLDGAKFDTRELSRLEAELRGLDAARDEQVRRERIEASAEWAATRKRQLAELAQLEDKRLEAVGRAEKAARDLAAVLTDLKAIAHEEAAHAAGMGIATLSIASPVFEKRISNRLAAVLRDVSGVRYGHLELHASHRSPADNWTDAERGELRLPTV